LLQQPKEQRKKEWRGDEVQDWGEHRERERERERESKRERERGRCTLECSQPINFLHKT
jgi:hypothetical protein